MGLRLLPAAGKVMVGRPREVRIPLIKFWMAVWMAVWKMLEVPSLF